MIGSIEAPQGTAVADEENEKSIDSLLVDDLGLDKLSSEIPVYKALNFLENPAYDSNPQTEWYVQIFDSKKGMEEFLVGSYYSTQDIVEGMNDLVEKITPERIIRKNGFVMVVTNTKTGENYAGYLKQLNNTPDININNMVVVMGDDKQGKRLIKRYRGHDEAMENGFDDFEGQAKIYTSTSVTFVRFDEGARKKYEENKKVKDTLVLSM